MNNRNTDFYTEISGIELSRVIVVLFFSTKISIEILRWIIAILSFSIEISDIELSQVLVVLYLSTQFNTEILTRIVAILNFIPKIVI